MLNDAIQTHPAHGDRPTAGSQDPGSTTQARPVASRPESEILRERLIIQRQLKATDDIAALDWQRITDDPEFRADLIAALFDLYLREKANREHNYQKWIEAEQRDYRTYRANSGLDGSEGNSGQPRDFDPCPWL